MGFSPKLFAKNLVQSGRSGFFSLIRCLLHACAWGLIFTLISLPFSFVNDRLGGQVWAACYLIVAVLFIGTTIVGANRRTFRYTRNQFALIWLFTPAIGFQMFVQIASGHILMLPFKLLKIVTDPIVYFLQHFF